MDHFVEHLKAIIWNTVWAANLAALPTGRRFAVRSIRTAHMVVRELVDGQLNLRAASLVYTTLLSLIPALAVSFAVMKAFNVHESMEPTLLQTLQPLGEKGPEIARQIISFVENLDLAKLGAAGLGVLMLTVVSLLHKTERALNQCWRVSRSRGFFERLSGYLTVVMVGPLLVFIAVGMSASVARSDAIKAYSDVYALGFVLEGLTQLVPYLLVVAAFTFIYIYIPNTKVRIRSALVGGIVAGVLWSSLGWVFASMVVNSARYTVVYSSFAILIFFMMWLHIGWLIVLIGGAVSFYHQNPEYLGLLRHELQMSNRVRERLGLTVCYRVAHSFRYGHPPPTLIGLARELRVPVAPLESLLRELEQAGILRQAAGAVTAYLPARSPEAIGLHELVGAVRRAHESGHVNLDRIPVDHEVEACLAELDSLSAAALKDLSLDELVRKGEARAREHEPVPFPGSERDRGGRSAD